jgi:hypothetical protein
MQQHSMVANNIKTRIGSVIASSVTAAPERQARGFFIRGVDRIMLLQKPNRELGNHGMIYG